MAACRSDSVEDYPEESRKEKRSMENQENEPPKKHRLSLSLKKRKLLPLQNCDVNVSRFADRVSESAMEEATKGVVPENTEKNNEWALRNFLEWSTSRSTREPTDPVPENLLELNDPEILCKWLSFYVMETRQTLWESLSSQDAVRSALWPAESGT